MAKKSQLEKHKRGQKFEVREYHRCKICGNPRGYMNKFKIKQGYILSKDEEETRNIDKKIISIIPAFKFLLTCQKHIV